MKRAFDRAREAAGGTGALAEAVGVKANVVSNWRHTGIPPARLPAVERATGIPMRELRPDLSAPANGTPTPEAA